MKTSRIVRWAAVLVCLAQLAPASTLYFGGKTSIFRHDLSAVPSFVTVIYSFAPTNDYPYALEADAASGKVFWGKGGGIWRMNLGGTVPQLIIPGGVVRALDVAASNIYFFMHGNANIRRADITGSNTQTLINLPANAFVYGIAVDALHAKLYWTQWGGPMADRGIHQ